MPIYERGKVRIHYEEMGAGFPLLVIPGGGLNSTIAGLDATHPFNAMKEFKDRLRCIGADLRNANAGQSSGPLEIDRPWDSFTDDHIGLMDHLGIQRFMVLGYCIGQPFIWNLIKRAGDRVVAAVLTQPSGHRPEMPTQFYDNNMKGWGPEFVKNRPEYSMDQVSDFLKKMYLANPDFVFTVSRVPAAAAPLSTHTATWRSASSHKCPNRGVATSCSSTCPTRLSPTGTTRCDECAKTRSRSRSATSGPSCERTSRRRHRRYRHGQRRPDARSAGNARRCSSVL